MNHKLSLIVIFILLIGCSSDPEPANTSKNVCFYSSGVSRIISIKGIQGNTTIVKSNNIPTCSSVMYSGCGYLTMYLKEGTWDIVIITASGNVIKTIITHDGGCENYDVNNLDNW